MFNEFVIEGNIIEKSQPKEAKGIVYALKKHSTAIFISLVVHSFLVLILFFIAEEHPPKEIKNTQKAIKSYLYKAPVKVIEKETLKVEQSPEKKVVKRDKPTEKKQETKQETKQLANEEKIEVQAKKNPVMAKTPNEVIKSSSNKEQKKKPAQATFSTYKQLDSLRNSINQKIMQQGVDNVQQFRSPSVMHGEQIPVPHSKYKLTPEQERESKTTRMSDDISITKYDNGICTIERKQFLGSPIEGSISAFACGESKFDKSFREHMKKVQEKIMPQR